MDPNATLDLIEQSLRALEAADAGGQGDFDPDDVRDLIERCEALDGWVSNGGYLPDRWQSNASA